MKSTTTKKIKRKTTHRTPQANGERAKGASQPTKSPDSVKSPQSEKGKGKKGKGNTSAKGDNNTSQGWGSQRWNPHSAFNHNWHEQRQEDGRRHGSRQIVEYGQQVNRLNAESGRSIQRKHT